MRIAPAAAAAVLAVVAVLPNTARALDSHAAGSFETAIVNRQNNECLVTFSGQVGSQACSGGQHQRWLFAPSVGGSYAIRNGNSAVCLRPNGASVGVLACDQSGEVGAIARWYVTETVGGSYYFRNGETNQCAIMGENARPNAPMIMIDCNWGGTTPNDVTNDQARFFIDGCPEDPNKTAPGGCGCGTADSDDDGDGVLGCDDECPGTSGDDEAGENGCSPMQYVAASCARDEFETKRGYNRCVFKAAWELRRNGDIGREEFNAIILSVVRPPRRPPPVIAE